MIAVDAGVLAYALNRYAPEHARAAALLEELFRGDVTWALPWPAVHDMIATLTHPHRVARPLEASEAVGFVTLLLESPSVTALGPTDRHADTLAELSETWSRGETPVGLELAAVLREHGVRELLSADPSMRRYEFLDVIDPLHGARWTPGAPLRRYRRLRVRAGSWRTRVSGSGTGS
jgi:predicted nucleic acid-binding protein